MTDQPKRKPIKRQPPPNADAPDTSGETSGITSKPGTAAADCFDFLAPPQAPDELGRLANYRVLKVHGRGGMGTVFKAEDNRLHRSVALKVMHPSIAKTPNGRARFIREARATAAIEHDHIVTIYDVSNEDCPVLYLAMQFLKGMTLEQWLNSGHTLNIPQTLRIGREIALALAAAHACRLIHRDIKPSNIWLDAANNGRVKILDFGLARPANLATNLTQEGMILGTPTYMSPEQSRGQNLDERSDLFSLGCVLYRLCSGKVPFAGKDTVSILLAITNQEPAPLTLINEDLPALAELVCKLLAKSPEDRPASAQLVVQAIQDMERQWLASGKTTASRPIGAAAGDSATPSETVTVEKEPQFNAAYDSSAITNIEVPALLVADETQPR